MLRVSAIGCLLIGFISGCAANQVSLVDEGLVSVEKQNSEKVKIIGTDVYQKDGQTWAYGFLKQQGYHPSSVKTHVDIQILSKDGSVQYETVSEDVYVPRNRTGKGPNWKRFNVKLAWEISEGVKIKMIVEHGGHVEKHSG